MPLTQIIDAGVQDPAAFCGRAVLHARANRPDEAVADVEQALRFSEDADNCYQAGCVYALLARNNSAHTKRALALLATAFQSRRDLVAEARKDPDLEHVRSTQEFQRLLDASSDLLQIKSGK